MGLSDFSTDQLLAEIVRRRNARVSQQPIVKCDECRHFVFFKGVGDSPDSYNPCAKRHVMSFRVPEDEIDDDWGYYLRVCADREFRIDLPDLPKPRARPYAVGKSLAPRAPGK